MDKNKKIVLLIEDNSEIRDFYSDFLSGVYSVKTANNGEEGLKLTKELKPNLILLDIMMPVMDGMAYLKEKNKDALIVNIPVVVLTNLGQSEVLKACFDLGAKYYILKAEITPDQILPVLEEALKGEKVIAK